MVICCPHPTTTFQSKCCKRLLCQIFLEVLCDGAQVHKRFAKLKLRYHITTPRGPLRRQMAIWRARAGIQMLRHRGTWLGDDAEALCAQYTRAHGRPLGHVPKQSPMNIFATCATGQSPNLIIIVSTFRHTYRQIQLNFHHTKMNNI